MNFLALDLGTTCGFAIFKNGSIISGVKKLRHNVSATGLRFLDFRHWLIDTVKTYGINQILYERVYAHRGTAAAHCYGGWLYHLAAVCEELKIKCKGIPVTAIKKQATGRGNATKDEMIAFARANGFNPASDDEADALAVLFVGLNLSKAGDDKQSTFWNVNKDMNNKCE